MNAGRARRVTRNFSCHAAGRSCVHEGVAATLSSDDPSADEREARELLARLRAGEGAAFTEAYELHAAPIFRFLVRLSGRRELAEDLFQETWIRLARHARTLRADTDLRAWLYAVARNLVRSHARWAVVDAARTAELARWWYLEAPAEAPHEAAVGADAARRLERALARLPLAAREVLVLVAAEGLPVEEAARALGITPEAARQRLHRARAALARSLPKETEP
jgi:RNA polymerase sigma-70 factor (ECF subfamily)